MTCVIVDAETPAGITSAATAAPSKKNFLTVQSPSAVEKPSACRLAHAGRVVNDARQVASRRRTQRETTTSPATGRRTKPPFLADHVLHPRLDRRAASARRRPRRATRCDQG